VSVDFSLFLVELTTNKVKYFFKLHTFHSVYLYKINIIYLAGNKLIVKY
jgi:hypothetical protein